MKQKFDMRCGPFWLLMDPDDGAWIHDAGGQLSAFNTEEEALEAADAGEAAVFVKSLNIEFGDQIEIVTKGGE